MYKSEIYPSKLLEEAVEALNSLPGVGKGTSLRLALHLLRQPQENVHHFTSAINRLRDNVKYCHICMMVSDNDICSICSDTSRDRRTICVVENVRDVMSIERTGQYRGVYHVLGGIISPINGVGPSDIKIKELVERVSALCSEDELQSVSDLSEDACQRQSHPEVEVILALSGEVEGETTSFYIYRQLMSFGIVVSSLARGLGFGANLEYADELTLGRSILNRQIFKP